MAWDTLQRWKEGNHVDTSGYRIVPFVPTVRPKISPWLAVNDALKNILPALDPVEIAKRRLAMAQIPIEQQKLAEWQAQAPARAAALAAQTAKAGWEAKYYGNPGQLPPGTKMGPNGLPVPMTDAEKRATQYNKINSDNLKKLKGILDEENTGQPTTSTTPVTAAPVQAASIDDYPGIANTPFADTPLVAPPAIPDIS